MSLWSIPKTKEKTDRSETHHSHFQSHPLYGVHLSILLLVCFSLLLVGYWFASKQKLPPLLAYHYQWQGENVCLLRAGGRDLPFPAAWILRPCIRQGFLLCQLLHGSVFGTGQEVSFFSWNQLKLAEVLVVCVDRIFTSLERGNW